MSQNGYVQLPSGVCSTTLGSVFNYPREYFQLPSGVCSTTLGSMFNYPGEYFQLPWEVFSATLGSIFSYLGEYFQLSQLLRAPSGPGLGQIRKLTISERVQGQILTTLPAKINVSEHSTGSTGINVRKCSRSLPSTCAGGQDDVSSQANSLKFYRLEGDVYKFLPKGDMYIYIYMAASHLFA